MQTPGGSTDPSWIQTPLDRPPWMQTPRGWADSPGSWMQTSPGGWADHLDADPAPTGVGQIPPRSGQQVGGIPVCDIYIRKTTQLECTKGCIAWRHKLARFRFLMRYSNLSDTSLVRYLAGLLLFPANWLTLDPLMKHDTKKAMLLDERLCSVCNVGN